MNLMESFLVIYSGVDPDGKTYTKGSVGTFVDSCNMKQGRCHLRIGGQTICIGRDHLIPNLESLEDFLQSISRLDPEFLKKILEVHPKWKQEVIG